MVMGSFTGEPILRILDRIWGTPNPFIVYFLADGPLEFSLLNVYHECTENKIKFSAFYPTDSIIAFF